MFRSLDPGCLSEHTYVRFEVARLRQSSVMWLNDRWLIQSGVDPLDPIARKAFGEKLLDSFAVQSIVTSQVATALDPAAYLLADRYGGTGGAINGGSGRCGSKDGFIAKGIGRTPLVSPVADPGHSNGVMSLAEALKEVVWSEVIERELPWGAVPVVAIIDTGLRYTEPGEVTVKVAAVAVRPAFVRPAIFERSIFFGSGGRIGTPQFEDALRVKTAVRRYAGNLEGFPTLTDMFSRFAQQLGAARALRLSQGRFLTSNLSIDGGLADFGSSRSVGDWRMRLGLAGECFGAEMNQLRWAFLSVAGYFAKYAPDAIAGIDLRQYLGELQATEQRTFLTTCLHGLGVEPGANEAMSAELSDLLLAYYAQQQSVTVDFSDEKADWFAQRLHGLASEVSAERTDIAARLANCIQRAWIDPRLAGASLERAMRFFDDRRPLHFEAMARKTRRIERLVCARKTDAPCIVTEFLERQLAKCTAWNLQVLAECDVMSVANDIYSSIALCKSRVTGQKKFWVQGTRQNDHIYLFGNRLPLRDLNAHVIRERRGTLGFEVPADRCVNGGLRIGGVDIPFMRRSLRLDGSAVENRRR